MSSSRILKKLHATRQRFKSDRRELARPPKAEPELAETPAPPPRAGIDVDDLLRALGADL